MRTTAFARLLVALALLLAAVAPTAAGTSDGSVVGITKIHDKGPAANRFNIVLLGDGYTSAQQALFAQHAQDFVSFLLQTPPFSNNCSAFNVYRVDVISNESGADDPTTCSGGTGATAATYFDSTFCADGVIRRLLGGNGGTAASVASAQLPEWDQALVIVNSSIYGGSGGNPGFTSVNGSWQNIAIHEFGHSAFGLTDEYEYWQGCPDETPSHDNHPAGEPAAANATLETNPALVKWKALIGGGTPVPTTQNANCDVCDTQSDPYSGTQTTGLYEGAHYYHCDAFRPVFSCMMRNYGAYCPVCTKRILDVFAPFQPANSAPACIAGGPYVAECAGATTAVHLNGGASSDFDCDPLSFTWTGAFAGSPASGTAPTVSFSGTGVFNVSLSVADPDTSSSCNASVTVHDTTSPTIVAPAPVTVECGAPGGTPVTLGTPTVSDVCDASVSVTNDAPALFPLGQTVVTWTATDDSGNSSTDTQVVTVADTTAPVLTLAVSPTALWPPNHRLERIDAAIAVSDVCDASPAVTLVSIVSDEPDNGLGDGDTPVDIVDASFGTDDRTFFLRAERQGGGDGRVYTITYAASDGSGNTTTQQAIVVVPHSQKD